MKICSRCMIPETHETIMFDAQGVCNVCRQQEVKQEKVDWATRGRELVELIEQYRGKNEYDCLIPFSGGKDSTYTVYKLVTEYKVKPLVVSFDHGFLRPRIIENNVRTMRKLGVDFLKFTPNWRVVRKIMLESLRRKGDFCWHCHTGIFAYPMQIAVKHNIPLIFWGSPARNILRIIRMIIRKRWMRSGSTVSSISALPRRRCWACWMERSPCVILSRSSIRN